VTENVQRQHSHPTASSAHIPTAARAACGVWPVFACSFTKRLGVLVKCNSFNTSHTGKQLWCASGFCCKQRAGRCCVTCSPPCPFVLLLLATCHSAGVALLCATSCCFALSVFVVVANAVKGGHSECQQRFKAFRCCCLVSSLETIQTLGREGHTQPQK